MTDIPNASGEKLSISRVGKPTSGGFLMIDGTFWTLSDPISSWSSRVSSSSRTPRSPTPALRMLTMGRMPMRAAVSREMTVCSEPVSSTMSISGPRLTRALTMIFSLRMRKGTVCILPSEPGSIYTGGRIPNARRNRTSARAHAAFALRSLFGSRLM